MTIGQVQEDCMDGGSPRGFFDLHLCGALPAVADIVADRVVEQHAVLRNDADRGAQASLRHLRDVLAVYGDTRSEEHTSELQSLMRISYAVFCLKKKQKKKDTIQMT